MNTYTLSRTAFRLLFAVSAIVVLGYAAFALAEETIVEDVVATEETAIEEVVEETSTDEGVFIFAEDEVLHEETEDVVPVEEESYVFQDTTPEPEVLQEILEEEGIDVSSFEEEQSASVSEALPAPELSTDKDDYHPGETATIFGRFFESMSTVVLHIFGYGETGGEYTEEIQQVETDEDGSFVTEYILDGVYRPIYTVVATALDGASLALTTFLDARLVTTATLNGGASVSVAPSASIAAVVNVTTDGSGSAARWRSTGWRISSTIPGVVTCVDHVNYDGAGSNSVSFNISAPASAGIYNAYFIAYDNNDCTGGASPTFTLTNGVTVTGGGVTPQTITVNTPAPASAVNGGTFNVAATASSGLGVAITTSGSCSGSGTNTALITMTSDTGTCTVNYNQAGNGTYAAAPQVSSNTAAQAVSASVSVGMYDQCSNDDGDGYASGDTDCRWTNGNLQSNNSTYTEGDATVQRLLLNNLTDGIHTVGFQYNTTKNGKHSYDFLTSDDFSESWINNVDMCDGASAHNFASCSTTAPSADTPASLIPADPLALGNDTEEGAQYFRIRNGVITGVSTPVLAVGDYSGTSETDVTVTFEVDTATCVNKYQVQGVDVCAVLISFGAHISHSEDWGAGNTAVDIEGSPYHVALNGADNTQTGGKDNQMQANAIIPLPGEIIVEKQTIPNGNTTDFTFNPSWSAQDFILSDGGQNSSGELVAETYSVSETLPTGWTQTSAICSDGSPIGAISLQAGETVTCVFTNTLQTGSLTVVKNTVGGNGTFDFDATGAGLAADIDLVTTNGTASQTFTNLNSANTYTVTESAQAGWVETGASCDNGETIDSINIDPGQTVTCTFTNTKLATLTVVKNTQGGDATFDFDTTGAGLASDIDLVTVGGTASQSFVNLNPANTYTVTESALAGWELISATCDNGEAIDSINLEAGETVTCTFTNGKLPTLTLQKTVITDNGGTATEASFTPSIDGQDPVAWDEVVTLQPGTYDADETNLAGYTASDWGGNCSAEGGVTLEYGDEAVCTITNDDQQAYITVVKVVTNDDGGSAYPNDFNLTLEGSPVTSGTPVAVNPGTYTAGETLLPGYSFEGFSGQCDGNGDVTVALGESKTCTLTNNDNQAYITVVKVVNNDYGGEAEPEEFSLTLGGNPVDSGVAVAVNPGTYVAAEAQVDGYEFAGFSGDCNGNGETTVALGESKTCTLTNNDLPASISGYKFEDLNGNGNWDNGEPALSGWTINLAGDAVASDVTDGNGFYEFSGLSVGTYNVTETQQGGWQQTTPNPEPINLDNGDAAEDVNFGNFELVSISGSKYNDDEGDGAIAGDNKLPGWTIRLYDASNDPWVLVDEVDTDGSGNYSFTGLFKGSYKVCEVLEDGWIQTFASVEADNDSPSASEEGQWCVTRNVTTSGNNPAAANFGNYQVQDLTVVKDADTTFTRTHNWTIDKSVAPENIEMFEGDSADVEYTVAVEKTGYTDSDWAVSGTITITNPNPASTGLDTEVTVSDVIADGLEAVVDCPSDIVPAGGQLICSYSRALPNGDDRVNTVTVETESIVGGAQNTANVDFGAPTTVVNDEINVDDTNGSSWVFDNSGEVSYDDTFSCDLDEGKHDNTVTIEETGATDSATVNVDCYDVTVTKDAETTYTRTFDWTVEKSVDDETVDMFEGDSQEVNYDVVVTKSTGVDSDWAVTGTITVTNDAPIAATIASVTDVISDGIDAEVVCPGDAPYEVAANGGTLVCTYSADLSDGEDRINTATAALKNTPEGTTNYTGNANVTFGEPATLVNDDVEVTDTMVEEALGTIDDSDIFEYSHEFFCDADAGSNPNTATVTGDDDVELDSDDANVQVNCFDLTVVKDADSSFTRTWDWEVNKTSATTELTLAPEQVYPVEYTVTVDASSADSDYAVAGTITITNPAPIDAVLADVVDAMGDIDATVDCDSLTVPANGQLVCTYTADLPNADTRTNTATVTLTNETQYSGNAEVNFADATMTEIDEEIELTDSLYGNLGTVDTSVLPKEFKYTMDIGPYPLEECGEEYIVNNIATATTNDTDTEVSDDHDVAVEVACVCSLTQGFWKTHNPSFWGGAPDYDGWLNLGNVDGDATFEYEDETFFLSGQTWFEVFWNAPKGNVYYNMAHQYMAAKLNVLNGAFNPTIGADLSAAEALLNQYTPAQIAALKGKKATDVSKLFNTLAGKFGAFNEGTTNPAGHCSEAPVN